MEITLKLKNQIIGVLIFGIIGTSYINLRFSIIYQLKTNIYLQEEDK